MKNRLTRIKALLLGLAIPVCMALGGLANLTTAAQSVSELSGTDMGGAVLLSYAVTKVVV